LLVVIVLLLIPTVVSDRRGHHSVTRIRTFTVNIIITGAMIASLIHLVTGIPQHLETPKALLRSASALWIANILVFALWYQKLDAGGPLLRERPLGLMDSSFLFQQMLRREEQDQSWRRISWTICFSLLIRVRLSRRRIRRFYRAGQN
jgi:hypothetical protein